MREGWFFKFYGGNGLWDDFPWYLTRTLHRQMDRPPADWDHLHTLAWMRAHAAHVLLKKRFYNREAVLQLLIENEVQFVGIFRHIVLDQIRWCLIYLKQDRLPDCALWGADTPENVELLESKRAAFRQGIEQAVAEFVRVLNYAAEMRHGDERVAGLPLRVWYRGAHFPDVVEVAVRLQKASGGDCLRPEADTTARFLSRRLTVPRIEVCPGKRGRKQFAVDREPLAGEDGVEDFEGVEGDESEEAPGSAEGDLERVLAFRAFALTTRLDEGKCPKSLGSNTLRASQKMCDSSTPISD